MAGDHRGAFAGRFVEAPPPFENVLGANEVDDDHHQDAVAGRRRGVDLDLGILPEDVATLEIPPRPVVVDGRLQRGTVSVLASPPGVGKTAFQIASVVMVATGESLTGETVRETGRAWLYSNEEDRDELLRRYLALCRHHRIDPASLRDRVRLSSGYGDRSLVIARQDRDGLVIAEPVVDDLIEALREWDAVYLAVDPFVSTHRVNENDNSAIEDVFKQWRRVASATRCAIELAAHIRKPGAAGSEAHAGNLDAVRGASSAGGAARQVSTLARMSPETAERFAIADEERVHLVRLDRAKGSYSPPSAEARWLRMRGVCLDNDPVHPDWVGAFEPLDRELEQPVGARNRARDDRDSTLRGALFRVDLPPGGSKPLNEIVDHLVTLSGLGRSWIYDNIPRVLPMHESREAEVDKAEFTWSKGGGKTARKTIHRRLP